MRTLVSFAILVPCLASASLAEAHIRLTSPTARYTQNDNGLKTAPCGSGTATGAVTTLVPGQMLTVTWKESVSHAGHYRIALSANASDFTEPTNLTIPTTLPAWNLADGIQDKTGTQDYSQTVQIPNAECPSCVLQLLQIMSAGTDGTNTGSFNGVYHACADVSISASNADAGTVRDGATARDARADVSADNNSDSSAVRMDAVQAAGGATGTGGSGGAGTGGSAPGTGGAMSAGGTGSGGAIVGVGGGAGNGSGGYGGSAGASGGTAGSTAMASGGSAGGSGGSSPGSSGAGGSGGAASGGSSGGSSASGGAVGSGGSSEPQTASTANGCSCQLGSHATSPVWMLLALLGLCLYWAWREISGHRARLATGTVRRLPAAQVGPAGRCLRR